MLKSVTASIPSTNLDKSRAFYVDKLGLKELDLGDDYGGLLMVAADKTKIFVYERPPSKSEHTLAMFEVEDIEKEIDELVKKGVEFEQYNMPGIKTDKRGIATWDELKSAWFKDPDGNILGLTQN